tara:strand:+ start:287 stop:1531 length:1245 start_codon:yes stop_codon:yes gene_type:complete
MIRLLPVLVLLASCGGNTSDEVGNASDIHDSITSIPAEISTIKPEKLSVEMPEETQELSSKNLLEHFSFTIDTLLVNSKNTIIYLPRGIDKSDLSRDKKNLYALNSKTNLVYQFDLDRLELVKSYQYEREGPNSVPPDIWKFQLLNDSKLGFSYYNITGVYNLQTQKLSSYQFSENDFSSLIEDATMPKYEQLQLSLDGKQILFLHKNIKEEKVFLGIINPENGKESLMELVEFGFLTQLYYSHSEGINHNVANSAALEMKIENNKAIITSRGTSKVYLYNLSSGSLTFKEPHHQLAPNDQIPPFPNEVSSVQEIMDASMGTIFQIAYNDLAFDDEREIYFRFGSIMEETENFNSNTKMEVYLFAYDQNFNLLGEKKIESLTKVPKSYFFKDGKLWSYVNVEDELGFAVFTFDF